MKKLLCWRFLLILVAILALLLVAVPSASAQNGAMNNINYSSSLPPNCSATGTFGYPRVWFLVSNWNGYTAGFYWCNNAGQWVNGSSALQVNGTETTNSAGAIIGNFNGTLPATPSGDTPVLFQSDTSNPSHISAYVQNSSIVGTPYLQLPTSTFLNDASLAVSTYDNQYLGTCAVNALTQGNTARCPFQLQPAGTVLAGPTLLGASGAVLVQSNTCDLTAGSLGPCRFNLPFTAGDTFYATSTITANSTFSSTDLLGNSVGAKGANYWLAVAVATGDSADCASTGTCDGIKYTTIGAGWSANTQIIHIYEIKGPTALDQNIAGTPSSSGTTFTGTASATTTATNELLIATTNWDDDLCGSFTNLSSVGSPSFATSYVYPVAGKATGSPYESFFATILGNVTSTGTYTVTSKGTSCSGGGAATNVHFITLKTNVVSGASAVPTWRLLNCLDLAYMDPDLLGGSCDATGSTPLTGVTLSAPNFFSVTGNGTGALTLGYGSSGLTAEENYFECVNSSGTAGLFAPSSCGLTNAFSSGVVGTGYQDVDETAAPADPASGVDRLYLDSTTHLLACLTSGGASCMPASGSSGITLENGGSSLGTVTTLNCSTGTTCSASSGTGTITASGGGGGSVDLIINNQTADYTLVLADCSGTQNTYIRMDVATTNTVTVPLNSSVACSIGATVYITQVGAGQTTVLAASGVTINDSSSLSTRAQGSMITLTKVATDEWDLAGDAQ